jgi:hypothetical protein
MNEISCRGNAYSFTSFAEFKTTRLPGPVLTEIMGPYCFAHSWNLQVSVIYLVVWINVSSGYLRKALLVGSWCRLPFNDVLVRVHGRCRQDGEAHLARVRSVGQEEEKMIAEQREQGEQDSKPPSNKITRE